MDRFFAKATVCRTAAVILLSSAALIITGCAAGYTVAPDSSTTTGTLSIRGNAHGGQQGISGGSVQLWTVGTTGYGSAATSLLTAAVTTSDGTGNATDSNANAGNVLNTLETGGFTITGDYTCSSATYVYLTVSGGNAGGGANSNIKLVTPLGLCSTLLTNAASTFINVDEVTTAATAIALGQYFNSSSSGIAISDNIGSPSTTQALVGLANAFATVNSLVNTGTGAAVTSTSLANAGFTVTATPEASKLYLIADILATCVNSGAADNDGSGGTFSSTACSTLYGAVAPTTGTTPVDTLEAAVEMSLNPTSNNSNTSATNLTALFGLQTPQSPYIGSAQSTQPADWTVGILYTEAGTNTTSVLYDPQNIAIDAGGNVWIVNASGSNDNVSELSPVGSPLVLTGTSTSQQYRNIGIDTNGNVFWVTASSPSETYKYPAGGGSPTTFAGFSSPYALTINGVNDILEGRNSSSACGATTSAVGDYTADTLATANTYGFNCPTAAAYRFSYATVDKNNNVWLTNGSSGGTGTTTTIFEATSIPNDASLATTCSGATYPCTAGTTPPTPTITWNTITGGSGVPTLATPWGIAVGQGGTNVWLANQSGNNVTEMTSATAGTNFGDATSLYKPSFLAVDGAGNIWVSNNNATSVSEFSSTGTVLSPTSATAANVGYSHAGMVTPYSVGIDPSGNVWVGDNTVTTGGVFEVVGAAAPTVTPIASALAGTVGSTGHGIGQRP